MALMPNHMFFYEPLGLLLNNKYFIVKKIFHCQVNILTIIFVISPRKGQNSAVYVNLLVVTVKATICLNAPFYLKVTNIISLKPVKFSWSLTMNLTMI